MTKETKDFRMGYMLNHENTMQLLQLALAHDITPDEMLSSMINSFWSLMMTRIDDDG